MRLLLLEDDLLFGEGLRDFLRAEGHVVDWCRTLRQTQALHGEPFDALLVDWQLPDGSGLAWLSARRDRVHERVQGLDAGADDYLVKPFAPEELVARLRAIGRRAAAATRSIREWPAHAVAVDVAARSAWSQGQRTELTGREWAVLEALVQRAGRIVPKADLEKLVLGFDSEIASNAIEVHVSALRRKLAREFIATVRGIGYRVEAA